MKVGAIYGCVLCEGDKLFVYMEDVGCYNVIDKIVGYMWFNKVFLIGKIFYIIG